MNQRHLYLNTKLVSIVIIVNLIFETGKGPSGPANVIVLAPVDGGPL